MERMDRVVFSGVLEKLSGGFIKTWHQRYVVLCSSGELKYYVSGDEWARNGEPKGTVMVTCQDQFLSPTACAHLVKRPLCFGISPGPNAPGNPATKVYYFHAETLTQLEAWMSAIRGQWTQAVPPGAPPLSLGQKLSEESHRNILPSLASRSDSEDTGRGSEVPAHPANLATGTVCGLVASAVPGLDGTSAHHHLAPLSVDDSRQSVACSPTPACVPVEQPISHARALTPPDSESEARLSHAHQDSLQPAAPVPSTEPLKHCPIAVVGVGLRYPDARTLGEFWENILTRRPSFRRTRDERLPMSEYYSSDRAMPDKTYCTKAAYIDGYEFDYKAHKISRQTFETTDTVQWLALDIVEIALKDCGWQPNPALNDKTSVFVGNTLTGEDSRSSTMRLRWPFVKKTLIATGKARGLEESLIDEVAKTMESVFKSVFPPTNEDSLAGALSNTIAGRICNYFDLHGGGYTVDGACASSLLAIKTACEQLLIGTSDLCIAGGVDMSLDAFEIIGFAKVGALTDAEMKVYDNLANGFLPGEGCGFVVLKRLEDAVAANDHVYAVINGWGVSTDGKGGLTAPKAVMQGLAVERAYLNSAYTVNDVHFIEGHGTGTTRGDKAELQGIQHAMGATAAHRTCAMTSLKALIGHTKAASGVAGFIKAVIAVNKRVIPPTYNVSTPNAVFNDCLSLYPALFGCVLPPATVMRAGVNSMGFGGINVHITISSPNTAQAAAKIVTQHPDTVLIASFQQHEVILFTAHSVAACEQQLRSLQQTVTVMTAGDMVDLAAHLLRTSCHHTEPIRVAITTHSLEKLQASIQLVLDSLQARPLNLEGDLRTLDEGRVFLAATKPGAAAPKLGFLFPGQGSQAINSVRLLVGRFPWVKALLRDFDGILADQGASRLSDVLFVDEAAMMDKDRLAAANQTLRSVTNAHAAVTFANVVWSEMLRRLQLEPTLVAGHSLGELAALWFAGVPGLRTASALFRAAALRGRCLTFADSGIEPERTGGGMASVGADEQTTHALLACCRTVHIANLNGPQQTVVAGTHADLLLVQAAAQERGLRFKILKVSAPFHSPFMAEKAVQLGDLLTNILPDISSDTASPVLFVSSVSGARPKGLFNTAKHLTEQVTAQVRFVDVVHTMADRCDYLLEVGPGQVLTGLVDAILPGSERRCFPLEATGGELGTFCSTLAALFARGSAFATWYEVLYGSRFVRPFIEPNSKLWFRNPTERPLIVPTNCPQLSVDLSNLRSIVLDVGAEWLKNTFPSGSAHYVKLRTEFLKAVIADDAHDINMTSGVPAIAASESDGISTAQATLSLTNASIAADAAATVTASHAKNDSEVPVTAVRENNAAEAQLAVSVSVSEGTVELLVRKTALDIAGFDDIDMRASMSESGFDSLKVRQLVSSVSEKLGLNISGQDAALLTDKTFADVSAAIYRIAVSSLNATTAETSKVRATAGTVVLHSSLFPWFSLFAFASEPCPLSPDACSNDNLPRSITVIYDPICEESKAVGAGLHTLLSGIAGVQSFLHSSGLGSGEERPADTPDALAVVCVLPRTTKDFNKNRAFQRLISYIEHCHGAEKVVFVMSDLDDVTKSGEHIIEGACGSSFLATLCLEKRLMGCVLRFATDLTSDFIAQSTLKELLCANPDDKRLFDSIRFDSKQTRFSLEHCVESRRGSGDRVVTWGPGDVVLVTGGGKGITAECALGFAKRTGVRLALVNSSPATDATVQATLKTAAEANVTARYFSCNLTDSAAVKTLYESVHADMGQVTCVLHGAAVNKPCLVDQLTTTRADDESKAKVDGLLYLLQHSQVAPKAVFLLSSIIASTGMVRNAIYGTSNEMMEAVLRAYLGKHPGVTGAAVRFSLWTEVGMAVNLGSVNFFDSMGISGIPTEAGVNLFLDSILNQHDELALVATGRVGTMPTWSTTPKQTGFRFIDTVMALQPSIECIAQCTLNGDVDLYLVDHTLSGILVLPGVMGLEAMCECALVACGQASNSVQWVAFRDVKFHRAIMLPKAGSLLMETYAYVIELTASAAVVRCTVSCADDDASQVAMECFVELCFVDPASLSGKFQLSVSVPAIDTSTFVSPSININPLEDIYGKGILFHGDRFHRLASYVSLDMDEATGLGDTVYRLSWQPHFMQGVGLMASGKEPARGFVLGDLCSLDGLLQGTQMLTPNVTFLPVSMKMFFVDVRSAQKLVREDLMVAAHAHIPVGSKFSDSSCRVITSAGKPVILLDYLRANEWKRDPSCPSCLQMTDVVIVNARDYGILADRYELVDRLFRLYGTVLRVSALTTTCDGTGSGRAVRRTRRRKHLITLPRHVIQFKLEMDGVVLAEVIGPERGEALAFDAATVACAGQLGMDTLTKAASCHARAVQCAGSRRGLAVHYANLAYTVASTALGSKQVNLHIVYNYADIVVFAMSKPSTSPSSAIPFAVDSTLVVVFPVELTLGKPFLLAQETRVKPPLNLSRIPEYTRFGIENIVFNNRLMFRLHQTLAMNDTVSPCGNVYFSAFAGWLGKLREMAIKFNPKVNEEMVALILGGDYGSVTRKASFRMFRNIPYGSHVRATCHIEKVDEFVVEFEVEWHVIDDVSKTEVFVADAKASMSWVAVSGHGEVSLERWPPKFFSFFLFMATPLRPTNRANRMLMDKFLVKLGPYRNDSIPKFPSGPVVCSFATQGSFPLLHSKVIDTDIEESNLVANVYYANYISWQSRTRDEFLMRVVPDMFRRGTAAEFTCLAFEIDHKQELMPFDQVQVYMLLVEMTTHCLRLEFRYNKVLPGGREQLAAVASHSCAVTCGGVTCGGSDFELCELPQPVVDAVLAAVADDSGTTSTV